MSDGPIVPMADSTQWWESGPEPIINDPDLAVLMVRLGLAINVLNFQLDASSIGDHAPTAGLRLRNQLCAMVTVAAFLHEAISLARENLGVLRPIAIGFGAPKELVELVGELGSGRSPAAQLLGRIRNRLGFHWDIKEVRPAVLEYAKNDSLVWSERSGDSMLHRLSSEVLALAVFPTAAGKDTEAIEREITEGMNHLLVAMRAVVSFFGACTLAYYREIGATLKDRTPKSDVEGQGRI